MFKLLLAYNIKEYRQDEYYHFIINEFLPRAKRVGLLLSNVWQTMHGNYPSRLVEFLTEDEETMQSALSTETWDSIETKLSEYVTDYERRIVRGKCSFQFFIPSTTKHK